MIATSKSNIGHLEGSAAALAMCRCILTVQHGKCPPTLHFKTLNPHLDHAQFDAIFCNEPNPYLYKQGHCQVSSFGVGGTNGHGIFWGVQEEDQPDYKELFMKKIKVYQEPVQANGPNPENWHYTGMPFEVKDNEQITVYYSRDPVNKAETVRFEVSEAAEPEPPAEYYCTSGNHNEWSEDRMMDGEVAGLFFQDVEVPPSGVLEFRILAEGDKDRAIAPEEKGTTKRTAPIQGPGSGLEGYWSAKEEPEAVVRIELMIPAKGPRSITWITLR